MLAETFWRGGWRGAWVPGARFGVWWQASLVRSAGLLLFISLSVPARLCSHTHLRSSWPSSGAELIELPEEVRLTFSEAITLSLTRIELLGPDGAVVELLAPVQVADSPQVVVARIVGKLLAGEYRVSWQTAGRDGHPVRGGFGFTVAAAALDGGGVGLPGVAEMIGEGAERTDAAGAEVPGGGEGEQAATASAGFGVESPLYALVRLLGFVGILGVVGVTTFQLLILSRLARTGRVEGRLLAESVGVTPARLGVGFAGLLAAAALLRLVAQGYALGGGALDLGGLRTMVLGTMWGWGWIAQVVGIIAAGLGFRLAGRGRAGGWAAASGGVLLLASTLGLAGHAAGVPTAVSLALLADAGHVLGAGGWLGSLLLLLGVGLPAALRLEERVRGDAIIELVRSFSGVALISAALVAFTGGIGAWLHLGSLPALWGSGYGRALLLKLGVVGLVVGAGAYNFLRIGPQAGSVGGAHRLRRTATIELAVSIVVLAVTSVLVALPTPRGELNGETADAMQPTKPPHPQ